jgi:NAD(P)H dehydrogenase (quinone)
VNVLIVYAHPNNESFNAAMKNTAVETLAESSVTVRVSDLYAMQFKATADQRDFLGHQQPFNYMRAQQAAAKGEVSFAPDIMAEQEKLFWAELVIFQFPIWWRSMPAIMKGYVDRIFAYGLMYGPGARGLAGRTAMLSVTVGSPIAPGTETEENRWLADTLSPIHEGILRYVGFDVVEPFAVWGPTKISNSERVACLAAYRTRLRDLVSRRCGG